VILFSKLAEKRIQDALDRGEFDDLPGQGEPLVFEDDRGVPEDLRLAYKILKNANCLPPELMLRKEIIATEELMASLTDERDKLRAIKKLNFLILKLNQSRRRPVNLEENERYYAAVVDKVEPKRT